MYVDVQDGSDIALTVIQILACLFIILGFIVLIAYLMFTRCLKRRPVAPSGDFAWRFRRATFKCKCFRRKAVELREPKELEPVSADEEDPNVQESRRSSLPVSQAQDNVEMR